MPNVRRILVAAGLATLSALTACSDDVVGVDEPGAQKPESQLNFLRSSPNAPPLGPVTISFYAKRGSDREIRMYYRPRPGRTDSTEFLRFRVRKDALNRRPDGTAFAVNDSILITVRVADVRRLIVEFQPSGLQFSASEPAELKLSFRESDGDVDGDGDSDSSDRALERQLGIWFQEITGQPWTRLTSTVLEDADDIEAKLTSFTSYAVAY